MPRRLAAVQPTSGRRAGFYVRVSKVGGRTGEDFLSPTVQTSTMERVALLAGDELPTPQHVWEDFDRTGRTTARRDGLAAAQAAAAAGEIDVLYVYSLHRWARNAADGLVELAAIEAHGVPVVSATENVERTSASGRLTVGMLLLLAEHQSDLIGESWRGVIKANAERGVLHGRAPIGYVRTARRIVEEHPVMGPVMRQAFVRAADGESLQAIARDAARVKGARIIPTTIRQALRSPVYLGLVPHKGATYQGRHPALVDQETFDRVQARLNASAKVPSRTQNAQYALAGLARCAGCGWALWARRARPPKTPADHFSCRIRRIDGTSSCPGVGSPHMAEVERVVLDQVQRRLVDVDDTSAAEAVRRSKQTRARSDLRLVLDEIARAEQAVGALAVKNASGVISDTAYRAAAAQLEKQLLALHARRSDAETDAVGELTFEGAQNAAAALLELWPAMTPQERNAALRSVLERVVLRRQRFRGEPMEDRVEVLFRAGC